RDAWDALDAATGDGDFGSTLARGFSAVLDRWDELDRVHPRSFMSAVAAILADEMGGASGPLWSVGFLRAGAAIGDGRPASRADARASSTALRTWLGRRSPVWRAPTRIW